MSYAPGTILSIGNGETLEQVIVLTDNKIATKTFAGKPVLRRDIMSLDDWKILCTAQCQEIRNSSTWDSVPAPAPAPAPAPVESYAVNTLLRWKKDDENRRTAMVVKDGVLQLKEIVLGRLNNEKKFFSSFADWKSTLPAGGEITVKVHESVEARISAPIVAKTDVEYIDELKKRFRVHTAFVLEKSYKQTRDDEINKLKVNGPILAKQILDLSTENLRDKSWLIMQFGQAIAAAATAARRSMQMIDYRPAEADVRHKKFQAEGRQAIYAFVGGKRVEITSGDGRVAIAMDSDGRANRWATPTAGASFAELGVEMVGNKPRLEVEYRKKKICI